MSIENLIQWFNNAGWLANALGILMPVGGVGVWFWHRSRSALSQPKSFMALVAKKLPIPYPSNKLKNFAKIAIIDDNLADFPVSELKRAGYDVKTYRHVSVSDFDEISRFDAVFLDMHDIVKDDPTEGGLKLIKVLKQKNPRQKICAVSGNQFNPSATAFFRIADDALNKPMSAQRCVEVLEAFLAEKLDPVRLATALDAPESFSSEQRKQFLISMKAAIKNKSFLTDQDVSANLPNETKDTLLDLSKVLCA